jgi:hypothetical protein
MGLAPLSPDVWFALEEAFQTHRQRIEDSPVTSGQS